MSEAWTDVTRGRGVAPEAFTTARLRAHRGGPDDAEFVAAVFTDPLMTAKLGGPRTLDQAEEAVNRWDAHWVARNFGPWILTDRVTGDRVGWVLLHTTETGGPGSVEVGWSITSNRWGEGLAPEAAIEAIKIAFTDVGLDDLVTFTLVDNVASRRVMEKVGFRFDREVEHANLPHVLYRLDRETWVKRGG